MSQSDLSTSICDDLPIPEQCGIETGTSHTSLEASKSEAQFKERTETKTEVLNTVAASTEQLPHDNFAITAPWIGDIKATTTRLEEELCLFARYVQLSEEEEQARQTVQTEVESVVQSMYPDVCVTLFGSQPLGLSTFLSDIDLSISMFTPDVTQSSAMAQNSTSSYTSGEESETEAGMNMECTATNTQITAQATTSIHNGTTNSIVSMPRVVSVHPDCLQRLYRALKNKSWVQRIEHRKHGRVPILNLTHKNGVECDVSLDMSQQATSLVVRTLMQRSGPALATLSAFLKIYLSQLGLDAPFTGGLGSYKLYVLLAKHIERSPALHNGSEGSLLGELLISFFDPYRRRKNFHEDLWVELEGVEAVHFDSVRNLSSVRLAFRKTGSRW